MITRHFRNTLYYIQGKKNAAAAAGGGGGGGGGGGVGERGGAAMGRYDEVDVVGALLKMGIGR
jgi:vacuolar protein sorting-associated protein 35